MKLSNLLIPTVFGLAVTGVSALLIFYYVLKKDEEWDDVGNIPKIHQTILEIKIPTDCVGALIGRQGCNLRAIEQQSDTRVDFRKELEDDDKQTCIIRGRREDCYVAEQLIQQKITAKPQNETLEMWVPQKSCGRIIGRNGENIRMITRVAGAKVMVDSNCPHDSRVRVKIRGPAYNLDMAQAMIKEKVAEDIEMRERVRTSAGNRSPRHKAVKPLYLTAGEKEKYPNERGLETLLPNNADGFLEVYVSSVQSPSHFWVQAVGQKAIELDKLVEQMTQYYSIEENRELHFLTSVNVGDIVAAPFENDTSWYRARVSKLHVDDYDPNESKVTLYYFDYGDNQDGYQKNLCEMRTDFLQLPFQAIECYMSGIKPRGGTWSNESQEVFDELTYTAQWKLLMLKVVNYRVCPKEGVRIPCVFLIDTNKSEDLNICDELVRLGFAEIDLQPNQATNTKII